MGNKGCLDMLLWTVMEGEDECLITLHMFQSEVVDPYLAGINFLLRPLWGL